MGDQTKTEEGDYTEMEILKMVFSGVKEKYFIFDVNGKPTQVPAVAVATQTLIPRIGDGTITNAEFRQVLEEMVGEPCPETDWKEFIGKVDYDDSGTISFDEFLYALYLWFADEVRAHRVMREHLTSHAW